MLFYKFLIFKLENIIDTSILNVLTTNEIFSILEYKQQNNSYQTNLAM